jgi:hypothetical protein
MPLAWHLDALNLNRFETPIVGDYWLDLSLVELVPSVSKLTLWELSPDLYAGNRVAVKLYIKYTWFNSHEEIIYLSVIPSSFHVLFCISFVILYWIIWRFETIVTTIVAVIAEKWAYCTKRFVNTGRIKHRPYSPPSLLNRSINAAEWGPWNREEDKII